MRENSASPPRRWGLAGLVAAALVTLGHYDGQVRAWLTGLFTDSTAPVPRVAVGGATLTTRNVPAMLTYGLLYVALSVLLLHLLLGDRRRTRTVLLTYGATFALIGALLAAGRVLGLAATLTPPARELIDGVLSPLPILLLLAAFRLAPDAPAPMADAQSER